MMMEYIVKLISLSDIKVEKHNVRKHDIDVGIEDLAANIMAVGLLQPITTYYDTDKKYYVILAGQRRLNAYHYLNENNAGKGFDKISCFVIDEPKTNEEKMSLSLAENITQVQMHNSDIVKAVTDLFNVYRDYAIVKEKFGLTKYMVDKYVSLARLPERLKTAITNGEISPIDKKAENAAIRAVDALGWIKGGIVSEDDVLKLSIEYAKGEIPHEVLTTSAKKGGNIKNIVDNARKQKPSKINIDLSTEISEKLNQVAENSGVNMVQKATSYVVQGTTKDYAELEE